MHPQILGIVTDVPLTMMMYYLDNPILFRHTPYIFKLFKYNLQLFQECHDKTNFFVGKNTFLVNEKVYKNYSSIKIFILHYQMIIINYFKRHVLSNINYFCIYFGLSGSRRIKQLYIRVLNQIVFHNTPQFLQNRFIYYFSFN